jgi:hypothetical protein
MRNITNNPVPWKPSAIKRPRVNRSFVKMGPLERAAEVARYSALKAEHWLSPNGRLREWMRLNILAALFIGIPALIIVPIVTLLLGEFATWMMFMAQAARNLVIIVGYLLAAVAMVSAALMFIRSRMRNRQR